ncbi:hypothetical protein [Paenibacillus sp. O199]|uniref:hypothetical protein n=1 Tax=Paenibacillus sp. O199 TaxID=1643925 RepID=UPI0007BFD02E|nr:hypothetical protein [Paenibacillus sp. O199]
MYTYTDNLIPIMTSMTTPSGRAFSSSYANSGNNADKAFDNSDTYGYVSGNGSVGHIGYEFVNPVRIGKYIVRSLSATYFPHMPKNWTFEGSNDDSNWTVLDTQVNQTWTTVNTDKEYIIDYSKAKRFKMYRLNWTANNGGPQVVINELKMFGVSYADKFLISSEDEIHSIVSYKGTTTAIPVMTSDTVPSGKAFAKSFYNASYAPWKAFNGIDDVEGYASLSGSGGIGYLGYEFPNAISLYKYVVRSNGSGYLDRMPRNWTFEGSNDGVNWNVLDTQTNQTWTTQYTDKIYLLDAPFHYMQFKMYRLNWTANNGFASYTDVNELKMFEIIAPKLVKLPATSESYFVTYGMNKGEIIDLASDVSSVGIINTSPSTLVSGKVFRQKIDTAKIPIKKASIT